MYDQFNYFKIEASCKKFDHRGKGSLTVDEIFNVVKLQNGIDIGKDEVFEYILIIIMKL